MTEAARPRYFINVILFMATFFTTTASGSLYVHPSSVMPLADGLAYSLPLLVILVCHESGHYFAAKIHGVEASLPYFIPMPPPIGPFGTMGAIIGMRSMTPDRRKLIDIGAAGPLAGLVVAIPILFHGLMLSNVKPVPEGGMQEGNSLLYASLKYLAKGAWLPSDGRDVMLHPTAWAGWAGLFITMLNLLPIGQLDGGHIAAAYFGQRFSAISRTVHRCLPLLGVVAFGWAYRALKAEVGTRVLPGGLSVFELALQPALMWILAYGLLWVLRRVGRGEEHPAVDETPLPTSRIFLFWLVVLTFMIVFMPVPLRPSIGAADVGRGP